MVCSAVRYTWVHDHHAFRWGGIGIRGDELALGAKCCWRVDAVLADGTLVKGDVWTFTVEWVAEN